MNYEQDMRIDESALDLEWLEQPQLMAKYSRLVSELRQEMDLAKEKLELVKAELDKAVRTDPDEFGLTKLTESVITNTIIRQPEYQEASKELIEANFEFNVASGAVRAVDQRRSALENLVRLYGQEYFAGPNLPRNLTEEREMKQKHINKGINSKLKRTKSKSNE